MPKGPCKSALRQLLDMGYLVLLEIEAKGGEGYEINIVDANRVMQSVDATAATPELACMSALQQVRALKGEINNGRREKRKLPRRTI